MHTVKVTFHNGDTLTTDINGTKEAIERYYIGNVFNLGQGENDLMTKAVKVDFIS